MIKRMELKDLKVKDVLQMDEFLSEMQQVMDIEVGSQEKAAVSAQRQGARICRTPLDRLRERKVWDARQMADLFGAVLGKSLTGISASERQYIYLVGMEAFKRTMKKLQERNKGAAAP